MAQHLGRIKYLTVIVRLFWTSVFPVLFVCENGSAQDKPDYADSLSYQLHPTKKIIYKKLGDTLLYLHVFDPTGHKATDKVPCFISIHGGGWRKSEPKRMYPIVAGFAQLGMVGISVQYRLLKKGSSLTVFDCDKDGRSAIRYVRKHARDLGIDPDKIIVSGGSAGGQIAAGTELFDGLDDQTDDLGVSCRPNALVLYYPVIDTSPQGYGYYDIGKNWAWISPLTNVRRGICPTLIFHGTDDTTAPYKGSKAFYDAMLNAGNICVLHTATGMGHTYTMIDKKNFDETMLETIRFLKHIRFLLPESKKH